MSNLTKTGLATVVLAIAGCASLPTGPNVMVLPGNGVVFDRFRNDDSVCEQYASTQVGSGKNAPNGSTLELQERYDVAYVQCMYAKGHRVPVSGPFSDAVPHTTVTPAVNIPPPPPGTPPAPPSTPVSDQ